MNLLQYFTDPILRAPTLGCMLLCIAASLMGVILMLQKRLLVGESISHAAYPGAVAGIVALAAFGPEYEGYSFLAVLIGALGSSWLGLRWMESLERKRKIKSDSALCFILAVFFGVGVLIASFLQNAMPMWVSQVNLLLFGQAATLTDEYIAVYAGLAFGCALFLTLAFRPMQALLFDRTFARSIGIRAHPIERLLFWLLIFSIVVGIRSVGVILMSGMLIAPAIAARQLSNRLKSIFFLAAAIGAVSGWLGTVLSVETALRNTGLQLPTGPMIVLVGAAFALSALIFSPKRGVAVRYLRLISFRIRCLEENILKEMWKSKVVNRRELKRRYPTMLGFLLLRLKAQGWIVRDDADLHLTEDGHARATRIVRLHRLWEVYLTEQLGLQAGRVHKSAEEMEHILTPEMEERLTQLLADPKIDPHEQPIPGRRTL